MNINVAVSIDLMTNPGGHSRVIDVHAIKHIWLVGNNRVMVQGQAPLILRSGLFLGRVSKDEGCAYSWFETREDALLTMRLCRSEGNMKPWETTTPC
jgi:hypothetical protein